MRPDLLALVLAIAPGVAAAEVVTARYACERALEVPATYVTEGDTAIAVIHVEASQVTLFREETASGARYAWPSDGSGYVWWTKGDAATLLWRDGATGTETVLLADCARRN